MVKRVALVGASSTGKTTVYELLKNRLPEYTFINESTRAVKSYGFPINEEGTDATQLAISSFHLEALLETKPLLLDRCYMDLVVYSTCMDISPSTWDFIEDTWYRVEKQYTHYIYFPIEFNSVDDGIRSTNEEWRTLVDAQFKNRMQEVTGKRLTVTGSPLQRVSQILDFINT